ncbi:hypothetical protein DV711_02240 [Motiliproteus coralliicola]|uniref:Uncharacterized protein n=1 Tax=Motiliproteus coralliicola TaxID=2283196 RepID=A0A369WQR0_9GAMM|nr:hypothetical protein [Motiliproteus coralliicola]RDE24428.1 hypothetical protein DV711_02240 [Motiliproteus coralliicola]
MNNAEHKPAEAPKNNRYDYSNADRPRDFDIRIEVAEQQEIDQRSRQQFSNHRWQCSEYDF